MNVVRSLVLVVALVAVAASGAVIVNDNCTPRPSQIHPGHRYVTEWTVPEDSTTLRVRATVAPGKGEPANVLGFVHGLHVTEITPDGRTSFLAAPERFGVTREPSDTEYADPIAIASAEVSFKKASLIGRTFKAYVIGPDASPMIACAQITLQ